MIIQFCPILVSVVEETTRLHLKLEDLGPATFEIEAISKLNLLGHAQLEQLFIGSQCGGHGICGRDRLWIPEDSRSGFSAPLGPEKEHLTKLEIKSGWRLGCQTFPAKELSKEKFQVGYISL